MNLPGLLADTEIIRRGGGEGDFERLVIVVLVVLGVIAVALIVARAMGWTVPRWVWQVVGVCVLIFVGVIAVKFLFSLL